MRISVENDGRDYAVTMQRDVDHAEQAVSAAMRFGARELKASWRADIVEAGLGTKIGNSVRSASYPQGQPSINAAAMVWTKAPMIVAGHETGALIASKSGLWLAIPLPSAGRGKFGRRITPVEYERRTGRDLRFVYRKGRNALLVADDARLTKSGLARGKGGRRRKDGMLTGAQTVPVFVLVPQVRLRKRTNLLREADRVAGLVEAQIAANLVV